MGDNYFKDLLERKKYENFHYDYNSNVPLWLQQLDYNPVLTTENFDLCYDENEEIPLRNMGCFLYHGIRFQNQLEKLESIFKKQKLLAGKYIDGYYNYSDNCNKGEYVSLLQWLGFDSQEFKTFIIPNISLIVSCQCNAIITQYVDFKTWNKINEGNFDLKNIFSYMRGECMCKDLVSLEMVKAIGISFHNYNLIEDIKNLMKQYNIDLPIVDTNNHNKILIPKNN